MIVADLDDPDQVAVAEEFEELPASEVEGGVVGVEEMESYPSKKEGKKEKKEKKKEKKLVFSDSS